jgi:hypothetical protein
MMRAYGRLRGLRRLLIPVPLLTPHLSGLWLALVTPAQARVGRALVEGLKNSTVVRSNAARETFAIDPIPLDVALQAAIDEGQPRRLRVDTRTMEVNASADQAFAPVRRIGGTTGWYFGQFLWEVRGRLDTAIGGVGLRRGRRDPDLCERGDTIDCWTVEQVVPDRLLRLSADMRMPGKGWLEFEVTPVEGGRKSRIRQTASFDPRGLMGRAYWLALLPFHAVIFRGMLRRIVRLAEAGGTRSVTVADVLS